MPNRTQLLMVGALAASLALVPGCKSSKKEEAPKKTPEVVETKSGKATPEMVAAGRVLFAGCAACHGVEGEGKVGIGPRLNSKTFLAAASDEFLTDTIKHGRAGTTMIPWGAAYKDEQIASLVAYIRSLNPVALAKLDEKPVTGAADNGAKLFRSICSGCHGRSGAGYQETANGTGIGRKAFLDKASDGFIRYIIEHGKSQTAMRPFAPGAPTAVANLTAPEIEDVIAHLRKNAW